MQIRHSLMTAAAAVALGAFAVFPVETAAQGQGKGQGKGAGGAQAAAPGQAKGQGKGSGQTVEQGAGQAKGRGSDVAPGRQAQPTGKGRGPVAATRPGRGRADAAPGQRPASVAAPRARFAREVALNDVPVAVRSMVTSNRRSQAVAAGALARAHARGTENLRIVPAGERVTLTNDRGTVLLLLDDDRARSLGAWDVNVFDMPPAAGAPAFCRSGAGHPVWGRQWCIDKGFGLGTFQDVRWGRTTTIGDINFGRTTLDPGRLTTQSLLSVLGATAFNRLALHAVTLGYTEPLVGTWLRDPREPQVLLVNAGPAPVAEFVDVNRDGRADLMLVALRPW